MPTSFFQFPLLTRNRSILDQNILYRIVEFLKTTERSAEEDFAIFQKVLVEVCNLFFVSLRKYFIRLHKYFISPFDALCSKLALNLLQIFHSLLILSCAFTQGDALAKRVRTDRENSIQVCLLPLLVCSEILSSHGYHDSPSPRTPAPCHTFAHTTLSGTMAPMRDHRLLVHERLL